MMMLTIVKENRWKQYRKMFYSAKAKKWLPIPSLITLKKASKIIYPTQSSGSENIRSCFVFFFYASVRIQVSLSSLQQQL